MHKWYKHNSNGHEICVIKDIYYNIYYNIYCNINKNFGGVISNSWKTLTTIEGKCGGVTSNSSYTLATIEDNCGGLTSNLLKTVTTIEGKCGGGWFRKLITVTQHGVWYGTNAPPLTGGVTIDPKCTSLSERFLVTKLSSLLTDILEVVEFE